MTGSERVIGPLGLLAITIAIGGVYAAMGVGFVLDDWFALGNAHVDGALAAAGEDQIRARPGAGLVYALTFGLIGQRPVGHLLVQMAIVGATAVGLSVVFGRLLSNRRHGVLVAALWLVLPNHLSLEVWPSATNISLALLLVVAAGVIWTSSRRSVGGDLASALLLGGAVLTYEAVAPLGAIVALGVPWLAAGRMRWRATSFGVAAIAIASGWILSNWHPAKSSSELIDPSPALAAHFGWGVVPEGVVADLVLVAALVGIALVVWSGVRRRIDRRPVEHDDEPFLLVMAGIGIIAGGLVPFATYLYAPFGAGDRFNVVTAVGGAMVWCGLLLWVWRERRAVAVVLGCALLGLGSVARVDRMDTWSTAGRDATAILDAVVREVPSPEGPIVLGPVPVQRGNVAAFLDHSNVEPALRIWYDDETIRGFMAHSVEDFCASTAPHRIDVHALSELEPDAPVPPWSCE